MVCDKLQVWRGEQNMRFTIDLGGIIRGIVGLFKRKKNHQNEEYYDVPACKTSEQFVDLVKNTFGAEFNIVENFDVRNINPAVMEARPYTLAFLRDDQVVLTILFTRHNGEKNRYFINAKRGCEERGIRCLNFFEHFPNEDNYVITRIRESL